MDASRLTLSLLVALALAPACKGKTPAPAAPPPTVEPETRPPETPPETKAAAAPDAGSASEPGAAPAEAVDPSDLGPAQYLVCGGQGGDPAQLAPMFLDRMPSCLLPDVATDDLAARGGDGKLIEGKGDCQYDKGITCHFHSSMEFVNSTLLKDDEHEVGEMHCIVPSKYPNSPTVYGAHLKCKAGTSIDEPSATASCTSGLLAVLAKSNCTGGWKCCDNGSLTKPVSKQSDAEKNIHPDFRICGDAAIEIDCGLLHGMHGHTANVVGLGTTYEGKFNPPHEEHGEPHH